MARMEADWLEAQGERCSGVGKCEQATQAKIWLNKRQRENQAHLREIHGGFQWTASRGAVRCQISEAQESGHLRMKALPSLKQQVARILGRTYAMSLVLKM